MMAGVFVILAYTRKRHLAEMWEVRLYAVYKPPFNKRRPHFFPRSRRVKEPVEKPVAAVGFAKLVGVPLAGVSAYATSAPASGNSENGATVMHADKPQPGAAERGLILR